LFRRKADVAKGDSLVEVRFLDIALDQAIDAAGFMKEDGRWIMPSRGADQKAVELVGSGWTGIEAGTSCGEFFGGEGSTAVLNAGNRSAIVELVCRTDAPHEEFSTLLYSFEFGERPVRPR
jgi:hypothetical protein